MTVKDEVNKLFSHLDLEKAIREQLIFIYKYGEYDRRLDCDCGDKEHCG